MIYNGKEVEFPAVMQVSFIKAIESLELLAEGSDEHMSTYAKQLLSEIDQYPALKDGIERMEDLTQYDEPIQKICRLLFPEALLTNEIKALTPPFFFQPIYSSTRFKNIVKASGEEFSYKMKDVDEDTFYLYCCYFILGSHYGYPMQGGGGMKIEIHNRIQEITRTYKLLINADMCEFVPTERAIDITPGDFEELLDNFDDISFWKKKFPPNSWIMRGVNIINLVDMTVDASLSSITSNLLQSNANAFSEVQNGIRGLLNNNNLEIGMLTLENKALIPIKKEEIKSILLESNQSLSCENDLSESTFLQLLFRKEPLVIANVDRFHQEVKSCVSQKLVTLGIKSFIIAPLIHDGELLGFIELGSKTKYELNKASIHKLADLLPILAMAKKRFMTEAQNRLEAIIQQECTTIHESVKWRFIQEAEKFMHKQMDNEQPVFKDIIFNQLYPLYGQMDIKGSSVKRNDAVAKDLFKQIAGIKNVLNFAVQQTKMPAYEELIFRLELHEKELNKGLSAGTEHKMLSFVKTEVNPVLEHLSVGDQAMKKVVDEYTSLLDPELKTIYEERKKYDTSVNRINQTLASYLDVKQEEAQAMYPHYFERYKTDGVEFNMYIGQSISRDKKFDKIFLRNLRIWQLVVMCEMESEFNALQSELEMSLEIASLILVYNTSLSVHFRMDEKRFDVEGAYNARYEIIKKRVDKAHIKGTTERITQPGHIAIVYSQEQDANEYKKYLEFLASKGYLKSDYKDFALEDLSGVTGLRALRAEVTFAKGHTFDELIQSVENVESK